MSGRQLPIILALGTTQTLAWASSYYLPAILADPVGKKLYDGTHAGGEAGEDKRRVAGFAGGGADREAGGAERPGGGHRRGGWFCRGLGW